MKTGWREPPGGLIGWSGAGTTVPFGSCWLIPRGALDTCRPGYGPARFAGPAAARHDAAGPVPLAPLASSARSRSPVRNTQPFSWKILASRRILGTGVRGVLRPGPSEGRRTQRGGVLSVPCRRCHHRCHGRITGGEAALFAGRLAAFQHPLRHGPDVMLELSGCCRDRLALPPRTCA